MADGADVVGAHRVERCDLGDVFGVRDDVELQARGAGIDDENRSHVLRTAISSRGISGSSSPCSRVGTRPQLPIHHLLPELRRPRTEARDAIDHVHDEVEAVEVVEHDDVEGRRRRALLL